MAYVKVYDLGNYKEITIIPNAPAPAPAKPEHDDIVLKVEVKPNEGMMSDLESLQNTYDNEEYYKIQHEKRTSNMLRGLRKSKISIRRYIKRYNLTNMYTFTFAENLPLSNKAENCGHWGQRMYAGKLRAVWIWTTPATGERIENDIYYNRNGIAYDLRTYEGAWYLWKRFIDIQQAKGIVFRYLVVSEIQKRGVYHFHVATDQNALHGQSDFWKYGFIKPPKDEIRNVLLAYHYITKYLTKSLQYDLADSSGERRERAFRRSNNLTIPCATFTLSGDYDDILKVLADSFEFEGFNISDVRIYTNEMFSSVVQFCSIHLEGKCN